MELPPKKVAIIRKAVRALQRPSQQASGDDDGPGLAEMLTDHRVPKPDEQVLEDDDLKTIRKLLDAIDEREATILRLRFGLDGTEPLTLKETGEHVGLTRERVRQIEIEALRKLNKRMVSDNPFSPEHDKKPRRRRRRKKVAADGESNRQDQSNRLIGGEGETKLSA